MVDTSWSRWRLLRSLPRSGRSLFRCVICGRITVAPDKDCESGCEVYERLIRRGDICASVEDKQE